MGRPLPGEEEKATRNEGVGILLDPKSTDAWKRAGENWEAVSSRIISIRLQMVGQGQRKPGGGRETYLSVLKQKFCNDLQSTLDKTPVSDMLFILGDMNARVGKRNPESDLWAGVIGKHGLGERNKAGEEYLELCAMHQLVVMNTWFEKKEINRGTWIYPGIKKWYIIDFIRYFP